MNSKRLRVFAGPNGSGKSTLLKRIPETVPIGYYINADEIEKRLISGKGVNLNDFGISSGNADLTSYFDHSVFATIKSDLGQLKSSFIILNGNLKTSDNGLLPKYSAAIISDFIREEILKSGKSFSFETVMSHPDKLEFIKKADSLGYHVYLYYICTDDVIVNIQRVKTRVKEGGHDVPESKIRERYLRSLELLYDSMKICYKSYLFDNSNNAIEVARIDRDKKMYISVPREKIPNWFIKYVLIKAGII